MATDRPRYTVSVDNELFQQIEDFRFERRFQTRSEATVELIRLGLESLEKRNSRPRRRSRRTRHVTTDRPPAAPAAGTPVKTERAPPPYPIGDN